MTTRHPARRTAPLVLVAAFASLGGVFACGGAASDVRSPSREEAAPSDSDPTTIEEAQARIARSKETLSQAAPAEADRHVGGDTKKKEPQRGAEAAPTAESERATADRCVSPCRALGSMRRAVIALCRMTGDEDGRCTDAKRTLADSERSVIPCAC